MGSQRFAKVLRSVPGQKNIVLFSRCFGRSVVRPGDPSYFAFQAMERELTSANARVFSVNTTTGVAAKIALGVFPEDSLDHLARTTGGAYFHDVNFSTKIASDVQDATASYYVVGFTVPAVWDGAYHDVRGLGAIYVNVASEDKKNAGGEAPFSISGIFPFPAKESIPLVGTLEKGRTSLGAVLRCEWRAERGGEIGLEARLFHEDGGEEIEIATDLADLKSDGDADLYLLGIEIPGLPAGRYRLEIEARNEATGTLARTSALFSIR